jgi:hypothetical protein
MGQGRTTTGMVGACLIWRLKDNKWLGKVPDETAIEEPTRIDVLSNFDKEVIIIL